MKSNHHENTHRSSGMWGVLKAERDGELDIPERREAVLDQHSEKENELNVSVKSATWAHEKERPKLQTNRLK